MMVAVALSGEQRPRSCRPVWEATALSRWQAAAVASSELGLIERQEMQRPRHRRRRPRWAEASASASSGSSDVLVLSLEQATGHDSDGDLSMSLNWEVCFFGWEELRHEWFTYFLFYSVLNDFVDLGIIWEWCGHWFGLQYVIWIQLTRIELSVLWDRSRLTRHWQCDPVKIGWAFGCVIFFFLFFLFFPSLWVL
jgi:hypothetical protein